MPGKRQSEIHERFATGYAARVDDVEAVIQREVFGANMGVVGYTTIAQAAALARALRLRPGMRLLDIGAGMGWPGLYLAEKTGCEAILTDVPAAGMLMAARKARSRGLAGRCAFVLAAGERPPVRPGTFDAVVHTDVLC
jgi:cyclopropane fatty-acyl-phospholipid synthase-like methyltransferase